MFINSKITFKKVIFFNFLIFYLVKLLTSYKSCYTIYYLLSSCCVKFHIMSEINLSFTSKGENYSSNVQTIRDAFDYLNSFSEISILIENEKAAAAIRYTYIMCSKYIISNSDIFNIYEEKETLQLHLKINKYYSLICETMKNYGNEGFTELDRQKIEILSNSLNQLNFITLHSVKFRLKYFELGGAKAFVELLDNEIFSNNFQNNEVYGRIVANLNWLSKNADLYKSEWNDLNSAGVLLKVSRNIPSSKAIAYMAFANIATDNEIDTLPEIDGIIIEFITYITRGANEMKKGHVSREKHPFIDENDVTSMHDVYLIQIHEYNSRFTITGILLALYKLSVNNRIKYDMYVKYNLKDPLRVIIFKGSEIEKKHAIQIIAQLCFDKQVLDLVSSDIELKENIEMTAKPGNCKIDSTRKLCEQVTWEIHMKNKGPDEEASKQMTEIREQKKVMISYNSASRDICLKIKDELEKQNFKVWIDVNEIHGSSLEAMARAVESSDFILMCVTEKYRQSVNCQAEAQYSFKLKKKIIPLILQKGLENVDGWLGIILGDKIFINFIKYPFEKCLELIFKEINLSINQSNKDSDKMKSINFNEPTKTSVSHSYSKPDTKVPEVKVKDAKSMNEKEVDEWLTVKNVPDQIRNLLRPCNGEVLHQLFKMRNSAPEFYFQSISKNSNVELKAILLFSLELEKLFEI